MLHILPPLCSCVASDPPGVVGGAGTTGAIAETTRGMMGEATAGTTGAGAAGTGAEIGGTRTGGAVGTATRTEGAAGTATRTGGAAGTATRTEGAAGRGGTGTIAEKRMIGGTGEAAGATGTKGGDFLIFFTDVYSALIVCYFRLLSLSQARWKP